MFWSPTFIHRQLARHSLHSLHTNFNIANNVQTNLAQADTLIMARSVILLGKTGTGKSEFGNTLLGSTTFSVGAGMQSHTQQVQTSSGACLGDSISVVDAPGLGDSAGDAVDAVHLHSIAAHLRQNHVHTFAFVFNSDELTNLESYISTFGSYFVEMLGKSFLQNIVFVFTHWGHDSRSVRNRMLSDVTEQKTTQRATFELQKLAGRPLQANCCFIDNLPGSQAEIVEQRNVLQSLMRTMKQHSLYNSSGARNVLTEKQKREAKLQRERAAAAQRLENQRREAAARARQEAEARARQDDEARRQREERERLERERERAEARARQEEEDRRDRLRQISHLQGGQLAIMNGQLVIVQPGYGGGFGGFGGGFRGGFGGFGGYGGGFYY